MQKRLPDLSSGEILHMRVDSFSLSQSQQGAFSCDRIFVAGLSRTVLSPTHTYLYDRSRDYGTTNEAP